jgi:CheY-like chemotaxis protein
MVLRALVVDSDAAFRDELVRMLTDQGHTTTAAGSMSTAVTALEGAEFDVMFSEVRLGRRSGMDLLRTARERWPRLIVVMLTAAATVPAAVKAIHAGALDYLPKPVSPEQVRRLLALIAEQRALVESSKPPRDPVELARELATKERYDVLLIAPPPPPTEPIERVFYHELDAFNPYRIREAVQDFATPRDRAAVVLTQIEELLLRHREETVAKLLYDVRSCLEGKGPIAVGYDPTRITATGAIAVRASLGSADAHATLDSLANPIRRRVLRRLADGPCSFTQAVEAAELDDTSKMSFHLRKLVESGLVAHVARESYRLTERGVGAVAVLAEIDQLSPERPTGNWVFTVASATRPRPSVARAAAGSG